MLIELERHNGICIMTTNRPIKLDKALQRRIDLCLDFPNPDRDAKKRIWEYIIPDKLPKEDIDYDKLSEFELNGGGIKNALMSAARKMIVEGIKKLDTNLLIKSITEELAEIEVVSNGRDHS
jgi:SpoVK/Ycf46/Vps4 family AAA+-type ATPase